MPVTYEKPQWPARRITFTQFDLRFQFKIDPIIKTKSERKLKFTLKLTLLYTRKKGRKLKKAQSIHRTGFPIHTYIHTSLSIHAFCLILISSPRKGLSVNRTNKIYMWMRHQTPLNIKIQFVLIENTTNTVQAG